jgi:hypothetical protein
MLVEEDTGCVHDQLAAAFRPDSELSSAKRCSQVLLICFKYEFSFIFSANHYFRTFWINLI